MASYESALAILDMALDQGPALADPRSDNCQDIEALGTSTLAKNAREPWNGGGQAIASEQSSAIATFVLSKYSETKRRTDLCYTVHL